MMHFATAASRLVGMIAYLCLGSISHGQQNSLQIGDSVPEFQCLDERGNLWNSGDHIGKNAVVLYFYPSDFAFCSTRQAIRYRDSHVELGQRGVEVVGVSGDTVRAHRLFKDTYQLTHSLLADEDGRLAQQFGVPLRRGGKAMVKDADGNEILAAYGGARMIPRTVTAARWTFIIGKDGRILYREEDVSPIKDTQEVLEFLCELSSP